MKSDEPLADSVEGRSTEELLGMVSAVVRGILEARQVATTLLAELRRRDLSWQRIFDESQVSQQLVQATLGTEFAENSDVTAVGNS